jgi:uncharacterized phage protein (TIGR01671 family)
MHKIKFRGKRLDNDQFIYGSLIVDGVSGKHYIALSVDESERIGEEGCLKIVSCEVDPETVGQYIGLKSNDVDIYVGSIIDQTNNRFVVENCPGGYDLGVYYKNRLCCGRQGTYTISALDTSSVYCQVVGNVHDNPELLELTR